jgi:hypothetical protein
VVSREMTPQEQRFFAHALKNDPVVGAYIRNQAMYGHDPLKVGRNLMVSLCCEAAALHHNGGAMCGKCGKWMPKGKTHKIKEHFAQGLYR